ncbi:MAG: ABC transporter permease [Bdellovibrionota bacterium]
MIGFILSVLRLSTPLVFASLGGFFSERSGVINIALEGFMLVGALAGAVVALSTGSAPLGFLAAGLAGALFATVYAAAVIHGRADQVVTGTAMNLLAMGLNPLILKYLYDSTGGTPSLPLEARFQDFPLWFAWILSLVVWAISSYTPFGLRVSFAGEKPEALEAAGFSVRKIRYGAVALSGMLAAWGGASLSLFLASGYSRNMTAGRGFMALAALIIGKWRPLYALLACLFFGLMEAVQIRAQSSDLLLPSQFIQALPYLTTVVVMAGFLGRSRPPKAIGLPI